MYKNEIWKTIKDFEDYAISNYGRVKRITPARGTRVGLILKPWCISDGYFMVELRRAGASYSKLIARLVAENFIGPCPPGYECNHKDGNKKNNCINNLEWVTPKENIKHAFDIGLRLRGEDRWWSKLNNKKVTLIKYLLKNSSLSFEKIGRIFDISDSTINDIKQKRVWKHVVY